MDISKAKNSCPGTPAIDKSVQAIFDKAMYLIDAQNDSTGSTVNIDTREYRLRTIGILNNLLDEVYPYSDTYVAPMDGLRPALDDITDFSDEPDLDAMILRLVLPYGLAAKLLSEENPVLANYFQQLYQEALHRAMQRPGRFEAVGSEDQETLPYGGIEHGRFARW